MKNNKFKSLIIIPAFNEESNIVNTVKNIKKYKKDFDYIIINDGSTDNTAEICNKNKFNVINLPINLGIGGAVQTGYKYAFNNGYDFAIQMDGDGQHDPEFLSLMKKTMLETDANMVIGSRFINKEGFQSSTARRIGIRWFTFLIKLLTRKTITDPTSGLRMVGKKGIALFAKDYPKDYPEPETNVAMICNGYKIVEIPVVMKERIGGISSISVKKAVYYMVKVTLSIILEKIRKH